LRIEDRGWAAAAKAFWEAWYGGDSSFRDLNVYNLAREEARRIFFLSKAFPPEEKYSLTDQIRRASRAVGGMIAEAWGRRHYPAAFKYKLDEALGEATEVQAWLDSAYDSGYISPDEHAERDAAWQQVGGMLNRMIDRGDDFCRSASDR
jgi:four helix bundle protein